MNQPNDDLRHIRETTERIERWLIGDAKGGQMGLISRLESTERQSANHERRIGHIERVGVYAAGALFVLGVIYKIVTDWWPRG